MNFDEILNSTIAGLIVAIVVAISTIVTKYIKKSYNKNKILFIFNFFFYFDLFAISFNAMLFGKTSNLLHFICLIIAIFGAVFEYNYCKKYIQNTY